MTKNILILVIICIIGYGAGHLAFNNSPSIKEIPKEPLPEFRVKDINGDQITHKSFKDKIIMINFWATWCPPCVKEFPDLLKLANDNENDLVLIALSYDQDKETVTRFLSEYKDQILKENIKIAIDTMDIGGSLFNVFKLPETYIVGKDGIIHEKLIGAKWTVKDVQKTIDQLK